jgi:molecular chaperone GrpE
MSAKQSTGKEKDSSSKKSASIQKVKEPESKIKQLKQELKEKNDKLLQSIADFQNYQKRMEKELQHREDDSKKKYLSELIDINELIKKAYEDNSPKEALKLILHNLNSFFEKEQIKCIDCVGKTFNHNLHHAISTVEKEDCENEIVVEEIKKGYLVDDKLLRPSQVIVTKKKEEK